MSRSNGIPGPVVRWSALEQVKKGEDFHKVEPNYEHSGIKFGVYCVFDGHNGTSAALHVKQHLLDMVLRHMPTPLNNNERGASSNKEEWLKALPMALAEGFLECNSTFAQKGETSGCTTTVVIVCDWTVTVAAVGDSRAVLDTVSGGVQDMSVDHRFEDSKEERQRVLQEGGMIARLKTFEGVEVGPLRSWPGGLCVSRSIGDIDCGPQITPLPHVRQIEVPHSGGRLIIASDGLWDAVDSPRAAHVTRGQPCDKAASSLVKESIKVKGLRDDITVVVIDLLHADTPESDLLACPVPKVPKKGLWKKIKGSSKKKKEKIADVVDKVMEAEDMPNLVKDHDSIKGGNLYERYRKGGISVHSGGAFCKVCGTQVPAGSADTEASIRAGNCYCKKHESEKTPDL